MGLKVRSQKVKADFLQKHGSEEVRHEVSQKTWIWGMLRCTSYRPSRLEYDAGLPERWVIVIQLKAEKGHHT